MDIIQYDFVYQFVHVSLKCISFCTLIIHFYQIFFFSSLSHCTLLYTKLYNLQKGRFILYTSVYQLIQLSISFSTILYIYMYIIALNVYHFVHYQSFSQNIFFLKYIILYSFVYQIVHLSKRPFYFVHFRISIYTIKYIIQHDFVY